MKFFIFLFAAAISFNSFAQSDLDFAHRFVESEDKWVVFPLNKDTSHAYGFIYIDLQAGLTVDIAGTFTIDKDGKFLPKKIFDNASYKVRLQPNNVQVAFLPESRFKELNIKSAIPDWLSTYKGDTTAIQRLHRVGFLYNGWNECAKALTYLERAKNIDINFKGLATELAFSYNCLKQYDKAIDILKIALKQNPTEAYTHKEIIYAQIKSGKLADAAASCKRAVEVCTNTEYHGENFYNLLYTFYDNKDKANFYKWLEESKKWNKGNESLLKNIALMEADIKK